MTTEHLEEFIILAETGNYQIAAESLYMSQATLSRHILLMEKELSIQLFDRSHHGTTLTPGGIRFLTFAKQITNLNDQYINELKRKLRDTNGHLRIGIARSLVHYGIPDLVTTFSNLYPNINVDTFYEGTEELESAIQRKECDFVFLRTMSPKPEDFTLLEDVLVIAVNKDHPLSGNVTATFEDFSHDIFLPPPENSKLYQLFLHEYHTRGIEPRFAKVVGSKEHVSSKLIETNGYVSIFWKGVALATCSDRISLVEIAPRKTIYLNMMCQDVDSSLAKKNFYNFITAKYSQNS